MKKTIRTEFYGRDNGKRNENFRDREITKNHHFSLTFIQIFKTTVATNKKSTAKWKKKPNPLFDCSFLLDFINLSPKVGVLMFRCTHECSGHLKQHIHSYTLQC